MFLKPIFIQVLSLTDLVKDIFLYWTELIKQSDRAAPLSCK